MNASEALLLCRYAKAASPSQHMDEYTPDAWFDLLEDLNYSDAREAIRLHLQEHPYVAPSDIRNRVKRIRDQRFYAHPRVFPTQELKAEWQRQADIDFRADDRFGPEVFYERIRRDWEAEVYRRIVDGESVDEFVLGSRTPERKPEGW